ncbi:MAG: T9SS type A sorting domain-containing protein [Flavobacteriales bacterium]
MKHLTFCALLGLGMHMLGVGQTYTLTVESTDVGALGSAYRLYVNSNDPTDKFSAVFGNDNDVLSIVTPAGIYNDPLNSSWNASGINSALFGFFPDLEYDSFATVGLDGPAATSGIAGAEDPSLVQDSALPTTVTGYFQAGGTELEVNTLTGASWYVLNTAGNALPDENGRWLISQITTTGTISGVINAQIFPLGVGADQVQVSIEFDGVGTFSEGGAVVPGCTDIAACNYDPAATEDDGTCEGIPDGDCDCDGNTLDAVGVCGGTCMMDENMNGICDDSEVYGCTNSTSCNYNADANVDDGSCEGFPTGYCDCDSTVPDTDNDGVCDEDEVDGCDDPFACNYDSNATENDGSCEYCSCSDSQYTLSVETVEAYNSDLNVYRLYVNTLDAADALSAVYSNAQEPLVLNVPEGIYNHPQGSWNAAGVNPGMFQDFPDLVDDSYVTIGLDGPAAPLDGNYQDASQLDLGNVLTPFFTENGGTSLVSDTDPGISWYVLAGAENALPDANGQILIAQIATTGSISGTVNYQVFPEGNQDASSYVSVSFDGVGTFGQNYFCGCMEANACNFDPEANFDDGSCEYESCIGCMDMDACNFDETATLDDGTSCVYAVEGYDCDGNCLGADVNMNMICDEEETGCTDMTACNFDASNVFEANDECEYAEAGYDCDGNCLMDADMDGICDEFEVPGCTDNMACNFNADATDDDGSCVFADEACEECAEDGTVVLNDADGDGVCDEDEIEGCFDETACNYNPDVTDVNNDLCEYAEDFYDCNGDCLNDADGDGVCDELEVAGCTNAIACNYDELATDDDGSCAFPGDACDDGDDTTINDVYDDGCDCVGEVDGVAENAIAFGMFPNPSNGEVTLNVSGVHAGVLMQVLDASGRVVWFEENMVLQGNVMVDLSALSSGTYNVMLSDDRGVSVQRLSIQR